MPPPSESDPLGTPTAQFANLGKLGSNFGPRFEHSSANKQMTEEIGGAQEQNAFNDRASIIKAPRTQLQWSATIRIGLVAHPVHNLSLVRACTVSIFLTS